MPDNPRTGPIPRINDSISLRLNDMRTMLHDLLYAKSKCTCGAMDIPINDTLAETEAAKRNGIGRL